MEKYRFCVVAEKDQDGYFAFFPSSRAVARRGRHMSTLWKIWKTLFVSMLKIAWPPGKTFLNPDRSV